MNTQIDYKAAAAAILEDLKAAADGQDIRGAVSRAAREGEAMLAQIVSGDLIVVKAGGIPDHIARDFAVLANDEALLEKMSAREINRALNFIRMNIPEPVRDNVRFNPDFTKLAMLAMRKRFAEGQDDE